MKIPGDTLLSKMSAELPSTEQIFTETSRLVPLLSLAVLCGFKFYFYAFLDPRYLQIRYAVFSLSMVLSMRSYV